MGIVFDIQRFCVTDGPGIRSVVFLKGCPLKCIWCHNPESKLGRCQLYFEWTKCGCCGQCIRVCSSGVHEIKKGTHFIRFEKCTLCNTCVMNCPHDALGIYGMEMRAHQVLAEVVKDQEYYDASGGGVTISGGEPMYQFEFSMELAKLLKSRGFHVCLETSGFAGSHQFQKISPYVDQFLYDYKATGEEVYKELTGVSNQVILENMRMLINMEKEVVLRCPVIPGYNLSKEHLKAIAKISREGVKAVEIIPYHDMGMGKAKKIGSEMLLKDARIPEPENVKNWVDLIKSLGGENIKGV